MTVAAADLYTAINTAWDASGLNAAFRALWPSGYGSADYPVLHDQEASPGQPYPFCVIDQTSSRTINRMTGGPGRLREIRDVTVTFNVHATNVVGDSRSAKQIAAAMAAEVMKVFGGHPTQAATGAVTLANGKHLITQYQTDYGVRTDDDSYQWVLSYLMRLDIPVAI